MRAISPVPRAHRGDDGPEPALKAPARPAGRARPARRGRKARASVPSTRFYPIFLDLRDRLCLVAGGGRLAAHKAAGLLRCGARVRLVAPELAASLERMAKGSARRRGSGSGGRHPAPPTLEIRRRRFRDADLRSCTLAIAATDDPAVNRAVFAGALRRRIPCNVVDRPQLCTFIAPSILRRGDLAIAISTGGASPALARRLRQKLQRRIGSEYAAFLRLLGRARLKLKRRRASLSVRKRLLYRLVDSRALELIRRGRMNEARSLADSILGELGL